MSGPWNKNKPADKYFPFINIDPSRWDKVFPYVLEVVDSRTGKVIGSKSKVQVTISGSDQKDFNSKNVEFSQDLWRIILPITPQQLTITDEFAIANTPTLRGILEEHNGIKYKTITMAGSTGIYPARQIKQYINKDSKASVQSPVSNLSSPVVKSAISQALSKSDADLKIAKKKASEYSATIDQKQTGYYHALYFSQFLEQYAIAKKNPANNHWRLVLRLLKDNTSYYITPISFSLNKNVNKPSEIMYSFSARAWKRPDTANSGSSKDVRQSVLNSAPSFLKSADDFRKKAAAPSNFSLISSLTDSKKFFDDVRKSVVQVKQLINEGFNVADLPAQIIHDAKYAILDALSVSNLIANRASNSISKAKDAIDLNVLKQGVSEYTGFKDASNTPTVKNTIDLNPNVQLDPTLDYAEISNVDIDSVRLSGQQKMAAETEREEESKKGTEDLKEISQNIKKVAQDIAAKLGAGDPTSAALYGRPVPKERAYPLSIEENELLVSMFNFIQQFDNLTQNRELDYTSSSSSPFKFTIDTAQSLGIDLIDSQSKILHPVPYNLSIEEIAARYLSDRNRWIEIIALNGLREPYIDESGFTRSLLSNGDGRSLTINSNENLYPGQKIGLASTTVPIFFRKISNISKLNDNSYLIEVDGEATLSSLKTQDKAYIKAYLPGTVNSQDLIFIPTDLPVDQEEYPTITQTIKQDSITQISKVDLLLTDQFDIAIDSSGDFRFSSGLTNLIQALKIKFITEKGSLLAHPEFGIGVKPGDSTADLTASDIFKDIGTMILEDGRFSSIKSLTVSMEGTTLSINLQVELINNLGVVPINFTIPKY